MPCYLKTIRQKVRKPIEIPPEQDLKDSLGALDHEDLHRLMEKMTSEELEEVLRKINEKRKRLKEKALASYLTAEAHYH